MSKQTITLICFFTILLTSCSVKQDEKNASPAVIHVTESHVNAS